MMTSIDQAPRHNTLQFVTDRAIDGAVTLACWLWFIFGFLFFFSWPYLACACCRKNSEIYFQRLNYYFFRIFFGIIRITSPRQKIEIDAGIASIRSSVVVCNHLSYLDPLFLIALFTRQKTIVKTRFFGTPVFGWMIKKSGYLPATSEGPYARLMIKHMETMGKYLHSGGNLFIFPEGTRSRDGKLGSLNQGALKIARMCKAPIYVLYLRNTDKLFTPGKFLFNSRRHNTISIKIIDRIEPDYQSNPPSIGSLEQQVRRAFCEIQKREPYQELPTLKEHKA
jgi:1-acyl-sn-glycerol-3-phosphate acyltransferase